MAWIWSVVLLVGLILFSWQYTSLQKNRLTVCLLTTPGMEEASATSSLKLHLKKNGELLLCKIFFHWVPREAAQHVGNILRTLLERQMIDQKDRDAGEPLPHVS